MRILFLLPLLAACSAGGGNAGNEAANGGGPSGPPTVPPQERCPPGSYEEECVDLLPAETMRGVWVTGFEQSGFIPDATEVPEPNDVRAQQTWLSFADGATPDRSVWAERDRRHGFAAFAIEFVGRRSRGASPNGGYGHLNGAANLVVVQRILSLRVLGPPIREAPAGDVKP
jgi:hypothetical protein